jgi:hypothetical protein
MTLAVLLCVTRLAGPNDTLVPFFGSSPEAGPHDFAELRPRGVRSAA